MQKLTILLQKSSSGTNPVQIGIIKPTWLSWSTASACMCMMIYSVVQEDLLPSAEGYDYLCII